MTKTETKKRIEWELTEEVTVKVYGGEITYRAGGRFKERKMDLRGYKVVIGHGVYEWIPLDKFRRVEVTSTITTIETEEYLD